MENNRETEYKNTHLPTTEFNKCVGISSYLLQIFLHTFTVRCRDPVHFWLGLFLELCSAAAVSGIFLNFFI